MSLSLQEREGHRATDQDRVRDLQEALDHLDLVAHLGAAEERDERPVGTLEQLSQDSNLALQQQSGGTLIEQLRRADRGGMGSVRGPEGVVDVDVGQACQRRRQLGVVLGFAWLVADILEQQDLAVLEPFGELRHFVPDDRRRHLHGDAEQLGQRADDLSQRELRLALLGSTEMRDEDQLGATAAKLLKRWHRRPNPGVVADPPIGDRHVEVDPDEHPLVVELTQIAQRSSDSALLPRLGSLHRSAALELLDEIDDPGRVAPLVVVPRHDLDHRAVHHHRQLRVDDRRRRVLDDVRGDDLVLGVLKVL